MQVVRFAATLAIAFTLSLPASAGGWPTWLGGKPVVTAPHVETPTEHLARFQSSLVNALGLQPHQVCVLHHNLLAQTEAPLPGEMPAAAPALHEALAPVLRPDQLARLLALPTQPGLGAEFAALAVKL